MGTKSDGDIEEDEVVRFMQACALSAREGVLLRSLTTVYRRLVLLPLGVVNLYALTAYIASPSMPTLMMMANFIRCDEND